MQALYGGLIGLLIGMRHALEPDHLAAVSTIVAGQRNKGSGMILGAAWGVGHTITLVLAGAVLIVLRKEMPTTIESAGELLVAAMLIFLGFRAILQARRENAGGPTHTHSHAHETHSHEGSSDHVHIQGWRLARRPLLIGLVHGLAGSGALTAAVLASMPTVHSGLIYIALFGAGSALGMAFLTGLTGKALSGIARKQRTTAILLASSGLLSLVLGLFWGYKHVLEILS
jgi:threonine/homoserine/homoserine lactone efflux protein